MWCLCIKCGCHKAIWEFNNSKRHSLGVQAYCKKCQSIHNAAYRDNNYLYRSFYRKNYRLNNKEKINQYSRKYHFDNRPDILERQHRYRIDNMDKDALRSAKRRAIKKERTVVLDSLEKERISKLYRWASILGDDFQIDHIVPLSKNGLHHPDNMQIIPKLQNLKKKDLDPVEFYGRHYKFIVEGILP